ncbi:MAG: efflux RND transporter periplasmic adaptor subunit [Hydrogenophilaceae bacterium]|nr:efflux RND transporter periplasmic adaptor subunit [Hydrogenophilaceae bacterium]
MKKALILFILAMGLAWAQSPGVNQPVPVRMAKVQSADVSDTVTAAATLVPHEQVIVRPEIDGRIASLSFNEGIAVKKGSVIVRLDDAEQRAALAAAEADYKLAESRFKRNEELAGKGFMSQQSLDEARANLDIVRSKVREVRVALDRTVIRAPFTAMAGLRKISPGAYVKKGDDIVELAATDKLNLDVRVPEVYLPRVKIGQPVSVTVDALPGRAYNGNVYAIEPTVDQASRGALVRARIPNPGGQLKPGMFARVTANLGNRPSAIVVPEQAILPKGTRTYIYKVEEGKANLVPVRLGRRSPGQVEVLSGISSGDTIVVDGLLKLRPGVPVAPVEAVMQIMKQMQQKPTTNP